MLVGDLNLEAALQEQVQAVLNDELLDDGQKRAAAAKLVQEKLKGGIEQKGRMFFGLNAATLSHINLTSSVAI